MQIRRSRCKSTSVYVAAGVGSGVEVNSGAGLGSREPGAGPRSGEPGVAVLGALVGHFPFTVAPLRVESLFGSLGMAKLLWGFL